jgi:hypothetical protein
MAGKVPPFRRVGDAGAELRQRGAHGLRRHVFGEGRDASDVREHHDHGLSSPGQQGVDADGGEAFRDRARLDRREARLRRASVPRIC